MKQWKLAIAGLAVAALAVLALLSSQPRQPAAVAHGGAGVPAGAARAAPEAGSVPAHPAPAILRLPAAAGTGPVSLQLTAATLERAWQTGLLAVHPSRGAPWRVAIEGRRPEPGGLWTLVGRVQTRFGAQAMVMTFGHDAIFGVLPQPDGSQLQVTTSAGAVRIAPAGGMLPPGESLSTVLPDYIIPDVPGSVAAHAPRVPDPDGALPSKSSSSSPVEITVLGLYTPDLVELRGSAATAEAQFIHLLAVANQAHMDSGSRVRLKLAGLRLVEIPERLDNHEALYDVTENRVEGIDLHRLRDEVEADLVAVLRTLTAWSGSCGVGWLNGGGRAPGAITDAHGFTVSNVEPCGPHVLAHEIGHNLGSAHERAVQVNLDGQLDYGVYDYSFGHAVYDPPFTTIMAYGVGGHVGVFSSPALGLCGGPCGVEDEADNVRSMNNAAPATAAFRGGPGLLSILDAQVGEPGAGTTRELIFRVRMPRPAQSGGVQFEVLVVGGTATAGQDYHPLPSNRFTIPEGQREARIVFQVIGDTTDEPDETIHIRLANVMGATIDRRIAIGTILEHDPGPTLSGRVRFDPDAPAPQSAVRMTVRGADGGQGVSTIVLEPPAFAYGFGVAPGASPRITIEAPAPFAALPVTVHDVRFPRTHDIHVGKGVQVSGRLRLAAGQSAPTASVPMTVRATVDGYELPLPPTPLAPPDFRYSHWLVPGARLYMDLAPPAPWQRVFAIHPDVRADLVQDFELSPLPALVLHGDTRVREGRAGTRGALAFTIELSAPAPAGGVHLRYRTEDGTATAGSDYTPLDGTTYIAPGQTSARTATMEWIGDDRIEGNEDFHVVVSEVTGAQPVVPRLKVTLWELERDTGGPAPSRRW